MMMTAMAISPMMRNVLSVATMLPRDVTASDTATIAPTIVPMIRRMSPLCAPGPLAGYGRAGLSRIRRWAPQRPLEQPRSAQCKPPAMLTAGDSSRAGTGNMCVRIADIEAVDKLRRFGNLVPRRVEVDHDLSLLLLRSQCSPSRARRFAVRGCAAQTRRGSVIFDPLTGRLPWLCRL